VLAGKIKIRKNVLKMVTCVGLFFRTFKPITNKQSLVPVNFFTRHVRKHAVSLIYVL
jgi:hypothetical protein